MRFGRIAAYSLFLAAFASSASSAFAQSTPPTIDAPPIRSPVDQNGVNLASGSLQMATTDLSIGAPGNGGLVFSRVWTGNGWRHNYFLWISTTSTSASVHIGAGTVTFTLSGGSYTSDQGDGSTLTATAAKFTYTAADGTVIEFNRSYASMIYYGGTDGLGTSIKLPSGEVINLHYETFSLPIGVYFVRLISVSSSSGYQLRFSYAADDFTITRVTGVNTALDYCDPAGGCSPFTQTWPTVAYSKTVIGSNTQESVTDALNRVTRYTTNSSSQLIGIKRPSSNFDNVTIGYDANGRVSSVSNIAATWIYGWSLSGTTLTGTVTDPLSHQRVTMADTTAMVLLTDTDALNRTTAYQYDSKGRLTYFVPPEGTIPSGTPPQTPTAGYIKYEYDTRGNVTCSMKVSKTASGAQICALPSTSVKIVTKASYPATCASQLICNKPTTTTDARGNVTDYDYDTNTGFVKTITTAAPTTGAVRPQTSFTYEPRHAFYKQASGASPSADINPIYKLTAISACATTASCSGMADELKTTIDYGPQVDGTANNLLPVSVTSGAGNGSLAATTTRTYDMVGNLKTVDGPLSGTADTTRYRFDAVRQLTGLVGPDPDGAGALKYRAVRLTYSADGQRTLTEQGTVVSQSDPDWANFVTLAKQVRIYDFVGRLFQVEMPGTSTSNRRITQYSYDDANRLVCTAARMKFYSVLDPVPADPCLVSTNSYGPDRITKNGYDAADQLTSVITALGTAQQRTDQTLTYTPNGKLETLKDAKNNLTTYEYDGFDRLMKLRYPSPSTPNTSSTTDYEQYTYDAASNLIQSRRRDNALINFTYDALNRVSTKDLPGIEPDVTYSYDNIGRTISAVSSVASLNFTYDQLNRLTRQTSPQGNTDYQYDLASRRTRLTWPDAFYVTYDYLLTGEMTAIRESGATSGAGVLATFSYDDAGRRTMLTRGNGTTTSYCYGGVATQPGCVSTGAGFYFTGLAQDLTGTASDQNQTFAYNPASQITSQTRSNDAYAFRQIYNTNRSYAANGLNQYTAAGTAVPTYDAKGNLASFWGRSYGYSSENLLTSAAAATLSYDPAMRLYQVNGANSTRFGYDGADMIGEYNTSNALQRRYVFGPGTDEPLVWYEGAGTTDRRWLHADERGSVTAISNGSDNPIAIDSYDDYGMPASGNLGRFQYAGQMWLSEIGSPPDGLYHYKARTYSPRLGRFMQTDPIGYAGGLNLYAYVRNDPVNYIDPTGTRVNFFGSSACSLIDTSAVIGDTNYVTGFYACPEVTVESGGPGGFNQGEGGGGDGVLPSAPQRQGEPQNTPPCNRGLVNAGNKISAAGDALSKAGAITTGTGIIADAAALLFPPAEAGTLTATAVGGLISAGGGLISLTGKAVTYAGNHNLPQALLGSAGALANVVLGRTLALNQGGEASTLLKQTMVDKAADAASSAVATCGR